ncbi:DnaJ domain-containing protein [Rhizobium phaseoli]|uniref:DnaJ domain-containing protein n=1 Tax=Rhizobium phaseoli TaxID=396 RepID=UPI0025549564|nr:DnaJ domain-containing protein [Rhizobium phaseoli]MDK4729372.1 DnaJ domain-containing protein [Rhizobium phaseoli]
MTSLYDTLGVAKDATADAIKKAFRSKAKKAHPDAGDDPKDFHALVKANDILSDPEKRQRYDDTGDIDDQVDTTDSQAMSIIAAFVDRFLNDKDARYKNMIADLKKTIGDEITTAKRSIEEGRAYELRALDVRKRVKGKKGAALIGRMVDGQVENARRVIASLEQQIAVRARALNLVDDAEFDFEKRIDPYATVDVFSDATMRSIFDEAHRKSSFWR